MGDRANASVDVSVLTPSLNYGRFIEDALVSVGRQAGLAVQHVVQDGGSSDETVQVLRRFGEHLEWTSEPDGGQSNALNRALERATGRWVAWLNADEFYLPGALARLMHRGDRTGADVVYGDSVLVDEQGRVTRLLPQHRFSARVLKEYGCYISTCSTIFRRSVLGRSPFDESVRRVMDWDLYMKLARGGARFVHVPYPIGAFRVHSDQVTAAPHHHFDRENASLAERHGRPADPGDRWKASTIGRWMHPGYKVLDGAYVKQWRAREIRGCDLRWFREHVGTRCADALLTGSYGRHRSRAASRDG
jgi:glycosyltransferase involved in cell wall biosynthesis